MFTLTSGDLSKYSSKPLKVRQQYTKSHGAPCSRKFVYEMEDVNVTHNGKRLNVHQSVHDGKVGDGDTIRFHGRLTGGALRQPQPDIFGQWTCLACGQYRVWPTRPKCFRCGCPLSAGGWPNGRAARASQTSGKSTPT